MKTPPETPPRTPPRCPRCDYDLSALPPTWEELCPLEGTCSECGLRYLWADVLVVGRVVPRWSIDHPQRPLAATLPGTVLQAPRPRRFWRTLRMEHPVRARAWVIAVCVALVLFQAWVGALGLLIEFLNPLRFTPASGFGYPFMGGWPWYVPQFATFGVLPRWIILASLFAPLTFLLLSDTRRGAKVSGRHALRIGAVGFLGVIAVLALTSALDAAATYWVYITPYNAANARTARLCQLSVHGLLTPAIAGGWLALCWSSAIKDHLRLPSPGSVTALVLIVAVFAGMVATLLIEFGIAR